MRLATAMPWPIEVKTEVKMEVKVEPAIAKLDILPETAAALVDLASRITAIWDRPASVGHIQPTELNQCVQSAKRRAVETCVGGGAPMRLDPAMRWMVVLREAVADSLAVESLATLALPLFRGVPTAWTLGRAVPAAPTMKRRSASNLSVGDVTGKTESMAGFRVVGVPDPQ